MTVNRVNRSAPPRSLRLRLRLRPGVRVAVDGGDVELDHPWGRHRVRGLGARAAALLVRLEEAGDADAAGLGAGPDADRLRGLLDRFPYLVTTVLADPEGRALVDAVPISRTAGLPAGGVAEAPAGAVVALSGFAYLRRLPEPGSGACVVESPLSGYRLTVHQPAVGAFVAALAVPRTPAEAAEAAGLPVEAGRALAGLLAGTGFLEAGPGADPGWWDFHDLLFHARSRGGRHDYDSGVTYARVEQALPPAIPGPGAREDGPGLDLPVPDWEQVVARDLKLTEVLESRQSVRCYGQQPVTVHQVGELLYRAARVRRVVPPVDPASPTAYEAVDRPYPAGGAAGELEVYLAVADCGGLESGVYRYDAAGHRLRPRPWRGAEDEAAFRELLVSAWRSSGRTAAPQVLIIVTSRFGRLSWKYSQIAYALTLKHVGALYQTLYLVATAMGLGPCALGAGDVDLAARALGLDWTEESSVGEFLIGSLPPEEAAAESGFTDVVPHTRGLRA
jgi:SagB-type dehydrogenase family enzyme